MNFSMADSSAANQIANFSSDLTVNTESGIAKNECVYCMAKADHPRLGRGESYACGYKPYRCEICNYSTVTKGNLAIHEQSDRHLNNVQEYDQHQKLQETSERNLTKKPAADSLPSSTIHTSSTASLPQNFFNLLEAFNLKSGFYPQDEISLTLLEISDHALFCHVCGVFSTDSVEDLIAHAEQSRIPMNMDIANQQVTSQSTGAWYCSLCSYRSSLKANFQLHCKTEKHAQRLSLLLHMWEGKEVDLAVSLQTSFPAVAPISKGNAYCQLKCLPCVFFTYSVHKMRVHCQMPRHTFLVSVFGSLVTKRSDLKLTLQANSSGMDRTSNARFIYACQRCEITCSSVSALMLHFQSSNEHGQLCRRPCNQDDVKVLCVFDRGDNSQHPKQTNILPYSRILEKGDASTCQAERERVTRVYHSPRSSFSHNCEVEKTVLGGLKSSRSSSTDKSAPVVDDEIGSMQLHPSSPTRDADISFGSSQSMKRSGKFCSDTGSPTAEDRHALHPQLADVPCQTLSDESNNIPCNMHITTDPLSTWLGDNLQNPEILQGLTKLIDEQKQQISIPRTCETLFAWFGPDNSLSFFVTWWLRYQFPLTDNAISNEFVALILEMIAHQTNESGKFLDLQELQIQHASDVCHQCSPPRSFLLSSSASIHRSLHHNKDLPVVVLEAFERMENAVIEIVLAFQPRQTQSSPVKSPKSQLISNHLEILRSNSCSSSQLGNGATTVTYEKEGLQQKSVRFWARSTSSKNRSKLSLELPRPPVNRLAFKSEHPEEVQNSEMPLKPTSSTKRFRTPISSIQQAMLLRFFQADPNPSRRQMDIISSKVNLPKRVVQVWFQNARSRERRMYVKQVPQQSQSPKPTLILPPISTSPWHPREALSQASPLNEFGSMISGVVPNGSAPNSTSNNKLQQIFNQLLTQMPLLGMTQPPEVALVQPPLLPASQPTELSELDSPLDLSTVSSRSNDYQSPIHLQNLNSQAGSSTSANETRSDNFCRRNRTSISSTQARFMLWFFQHHKTPTISECENIGHAIGLSRRVVQVWFQNQRAKEKKIARATAICGEVSSSNPPTKTDDLHLLIEGNECKLCKIKIARVNEEDTNAITEHIFTKSHIHRLLSRVCQGDSCTMATEKSPYQQPELSSDCEPKSFPI